MEYVTNTNTFPGSIISVPGGFILRFINRLFSNLIGQLQIVMIEIYISTGASTVHTLCVFGGCGQFTSDCSA